jgi:hypothetical protein
MGTYPSQAVNKVLAIWRFFAKNKAPPKSAGFVSGLGEKSFNYS